MSTLSQLKRFLNRRLDLQRNGGVLFDRDNQTLLMTDVHVFTQAHAKLLESSFPQVRFAVMSCETSASGFIVVFSSCTEQDRACARLCGYCCTYFVFWPPLPHKLKKIRRGVGV
jgi:hypothetical protein